MAGQRHDFTEVQIEGQNDALLAAGQRVQEDPPDLTRNLQLEPYP